MTWRKAQVFLVLLSIWFGVLVFGYQQATVGAHELAYRKSLAFSNSIGSLLNDIKGQFDLIGHTIVRGGRSYTGLHELAAHLNKLQPLLRTIIVTNADGTVIADSRKGEPAKGRNISDRGYFRVHLKEQNRTIFLGKPVRSRVDGQWSIPVSMAVRSKDNGLVAVVASAVDPKGLSRFLYTRFRLGDYTAAVLSPSKEITTLIPYDAELVAKRDRFWIVNHETNSSRLATNLFGNIEHTSKEPIYGSTVIIRIGHESIISGFTDFFLKTLFAFSIIWIASVWHMSRDDKTKAIALMGSLRFPKKFETPFSTGSGAINL